MPGTDLTRYGMTDKKRQTKLAQKSQSEEPAETSIPSGVDTLDPEFVTWSLSLRFCDQTVTSLPDTHHCTIYRLRLVDDDRPNDTANKEQARADDREKSGEHERPRSFRNASARGCSVLEC